MFKDENRHYSLRKLSVGLASVLIGISFASGMNGNSVKADTVSSQTSAIETKTSENKVITNVDVTKEVVKDQKITNQSNDHAEDNSQTQLQKLDITKISQQLNQKELATKSIVSPSSAQNQSNDHAEDNSQSQNEQKLDITKNSKKFAKKALATNLTENQAINDSTDPSQIDPSHFADGTHWTTAGWTRTDKNTKVAKKSSLVISDWEDGHNESTPWRQPVTNNTVYYVQDLNFTIDKNDMKKGNKILIATVQNLPTNTKQAIDGSQLFMYNWYLTDKYNINYQNKTIGNITASQLDKDEIDLYFNPTTTLNNLNDLASDPTFNIHLGRAISVDNMDRKDYAKYHTNFPYNYCIVTNHNIREYDTYIANTTNPLPKNTVDQWYNWSRYNFGFPGWSGLAITNSEHQLTGDKNINDADYIVKIQSINNSNLDPRSIRINTTTYFSVIDANGNPTDEISEMYDSDDKNGLKQAQDNLSSIDLWNATPTGYSYYSKQHDGSILLCIKQRPNIDSINQINQHSLRNWADGSYLANVQDLDHKQQIIDNTVNKTKGWVAYTSDFKLGSYGIYQITDVTPSNYSKHTNLGTTTVKFLDPNLNIPNMPSGSADFETYKNVKISYIDDDATGSTKSDISSDAMTGRQNKASTYTVNIPKGYYLDDNNTSTGYTWNADHTAISYTFNEDQAKNNANPIEIHLKHKHTAITDSSQLQTNGKRTITITLPHQEKPMIIVQTVGYKRTGDLDEATNTPTYTAWVFDADTSNVTVNGQISTQYQAYVLKNGVVNYAPIKLPHINGYKAKLIKDKANPAMFMVSFVAVPQQNNQSNNVQSSQKNTQAEQKQPEPIQTKPAKQETLDVIIVHMPDGTTKTYVQTIGFVNNIDKDLVTNKTTNIYTVDASKSNTTVNGTVDSSIHAYRKTGNDDATGTNYKFASFVLPKIPGYKAFVKTVANPVNPARALFAVSFMALPKPATSVPNDAKTTKTVSPATPVAIEVAKSIKAELKVVTTPKVIDLSNDVVTTTPDVYAWHVADEPDQDTYHVSNGQYAVELPHISNAQLHVIANDSTKDSVLFTYKGQNSKYVFKIKFANGHYLLTTYKIKSGKLVKLIDYNFTKSSKMIDVILDWFQLR